MGCSPSQSVFIQSSTTSHDTFCLQPTILMVSERTVKLLKDVGELKVFHVDETDHSSTLEKYGFAQDQLANPLLYQPQVRSAQPNACSIFEKATINDSKTTIHSQQSLTTSDTDGVGEEKFRQAVTETETTDCEPEKKMLSEPSEMQPNDLHEIQTEQTTSVVVEEKLRKEEIEDNPNRSGSKTECNPKTMDLGSAGKTKTDKRSRFIKLRGKEPFDMLTPVECKEMVNRSIFKTPELVSQSPEDTINVIERKKNEQDASNSPENVDQEREGGSAVVVEQENDDKQTHNAVKDMLMNSESAIETFGVRSECEGCGSSEGPRFIRVASLNLDEEQTVQD